MHSIATMPWCPKNAPVEIYNFLIMCPLPRRKCLDALALSITKQTGLVVAHTLMDNPLCDWNTYTTSGLISHPTEPSKKWWCHCQPTATATKMPSRGLFSFITFWIIRSGSLMGVIERRVMCEGKWCSPLLSVGERWWVRWSHAWWCDNKRWWMLMRMGWMELMRWAEEDRGYSSWEIEYSSSVRGRRDVEECWV